MVSYEKVVYPIPPPTTNSLTSSQRAHLLRTTKKLTRVLGTTPQFGDYDDLSLHISRTLPGGYASRHRRTNSISAFSFDNASSSSMTDTDDSLSTSRPISRASSLRSTRSYLTSSEQKTFQRPPVLRLTFSSLSCSSDTDESELEQDIRFTITPPTPVQSSVPFPTAFAVPSNNSIRMKKMERLRRKFGDDIPADLVFRQTTTEAPPLAPTFLLQEPKRVVKEKALPPPPPAQALALPVPKARSRSDRSITKARDSLIITGSPHRATRQKVKRKPVPNIIPSRPPPPPPVSTSVASKRSSQHISKRSLERARLSLIIESPDEPSLVPLTPMSESGYSGDSEPSSPTSISTTVNLSVSYIPITA